MATIENFALTNKMNIVLDVLLFLQPVDGGRCTSERSHGSLWITLTNNLFFLLSLLPVCLSVCLVSPAPLIHPHQSFQLHLLFISVDNGALQLFFQTPPPM